MVDDSGWPLVRVRFPQTITDEAWSEYLGVLERFPDRREPYVTLTDGRGAPSPNASQRKLAAELIAREAERTKRWSVANAVVIDSALLRGVITAIEWAAPSPVPMKSFASLEEAAAWLDARYRERTGAPLPKVASALR